jgi:hypothetical protein
MMAPMVNLRGLLRGLHGHDISYLVSGAMAMVFYGYVRNTEDLDLIVDPDPQNLERIADWLTAAGATLRLNPMRAFGERERTGLHRGAKVSVLTKLGQLDIDQQLPGLPEWSQLVAQAEIFETDGMQIPVLDRETLVELKRNRGSFLDRADIDAIEQLSGRWEESEDY